MSSMSKSDREVDRGLFDGSDDVVDRPRDVADILAVHCVIVNMTIWGSGRGSLTARQRDSAGLKYVDMMALANGDGLARSQSRVGEHANLVVLVVFCFYALCC